MGKNPEEFLLDSGVADLASLLQREGYHVRTAASQTEAVNLMSAYPSGLVLMEIENTPAHEGVEPKRRHALLCGQPTAGPDLSTCVRLKAGAIEIDLRRRAVRVGGEVLRVTKREFEIIEYLAHHLGRAVHRETLFRALWGYDSTFNSNSLDVLIYRLRRKLEGDTLTPRHLVTLRGYGYRLQA